MKSTDLEAYLSHYDTHPEEFKDEPPLGGCGTIDIDDRTLSGESTADDMDRPADYKRKRWEDYHLVKVKSHRNKVDIQVEEMKKELIPADEVLNRWRNMFLNVRVKLLAMPNKCAVDLVAEDTVPGCQQVLKKAVYEALIELSRKG